MEIWQYIIPGLFSIIVVVIELRGARERKEAKAGLDRTEKRAARRAEESQLSMELMSANCKLGVVTAKALTNQHTNGDVKEAMEAAKEAQEAYDSFIKRQSALQVSKM